MREMFRYDGSTVAAEGATEQSLHRAPEATMFQTVLPARVDETMVTIRSSACWVGRTRTACFSCGWLSDVLGLFCPADSAIDWSQSGGSRPPLDEVKYFQLIFVRRISAPTLEDIVHFYAEDIEHLYEDYDVQCDDRYVMNHCRHCGARFGDAKLFASPEAVFNRSCAARGGRIALQRRAVLIFATGRAAPVEDHVVAAIEGAAPPARSSGGPA
jgi:hypothetical protein